jgi:hypothetical protein
MSLFATGKITEIFCVTDDFCKEFSRKRKNIQLPRILAEHVICRIKKCCIVKEQF